MKKINEFKEVVALMSLGQLEVMMDERVTTLNSHVNAADECRAALVVLRDEKQKRMLG